MYKFFKRIGLILLVFVSFIYTEKVTLVVKEYDKLMLDIKEYDRNYKKEMVEAIIHDNTIIPGIAGKKIDIDKSYNKMRFNNKFDENLLEYKLDYPKYRLSNNIDKYIIGTQKKEVALIIKINKDFDKSILETNDKLSFYMNDSFIKNNTLLVTNLVKWNYTILNNQSYYLKTIIGQEKTFCMTEHMDDSLLKECNNNKSYTVIPNIIVKNNYYKLNKDLSNGSIVLTDINNYKNVLKIIKNKGYKLSTISELLSE